MKSIFLFYKLFFFVYIWNKYKNMQPYIGERFKTFLWFFLDSNNFILFYN